MDTKEAGRMGAKITNTILTTEIRRKAAKKGWKNRRKASKEPLPLKQSSQSIE